MAPFTGLRAALTQIYPPKPVFTGADVPAGSLQGRVYIVTGGNAGIGLELVKILYAGGATIYIASRSKAKVEAAIQAITSPSSNTPTTSGKLKFLHLDLNDLKTVTAAAASFAEQESKLDVLWNNAGTGANTVPLGERTLQDFELFIGRHCIATLLFTQLLLPQLRAAAAAASPDKGQTRVIWTSSALAEVGSPPNGIDWAVIDQGTNKLAQNYGVSKAGTWFLSREFARRYKKDGIVSVCLNPGYLKTASFNGTPALVMFIINRIMLSEPIYGAYTELFAGLSPEVTLENSGAYIIPWGRVRPDSATGRQDLIKAGASTEEEGLGYGAKLWEWCEKQWAPYV
ncbi:NAD(P)-binding protein [Aspergillus aculeatinus CBS 121060]|uniref:NAD(P)-binding protein n=1 Tax=Aspergillus aculeatinus CBS 121060 TaxID=1448322 RepID=A0ACD1GVV3_9EURO|nr:NAD(P)-binding protein [Aspergillus aculeatinus CBS 121060]RAH65580.1 NAD(P)-binding protein [Aspergillus aculeatinus CBS 121060]